MGVSVHRHNNWAAQHLQATVSWLQWSCLTVSVTVHRHNNWAASPMKGRAAAKSRRVSLMEEGGYEQAASSGNGRRIRKPLNSDFVYYSNAGE